MTGEVIVGDIEMFCDGKHFLQRNRPLRNAIGQRWSFDKFQNECSDAVGFLESVDTRDVGMVQRGERFGFALKAGDALRICDERVRQDLDRNIAPELCIVRTIDLARSYRGASRATRHRSADHALDGAGFRLYLAEQYFGRERLSLLREDRAICLANVALVLERV